MTAADLPAAWLVVDLPERDPQRHPLGAGAVRIGRSADSDVVVGHVSVSRAHCEVRPGPRGWVVEDLGSANGTWVGRRRVGARPRGLRAGEVLRLGGVSARIEGTRPVPADGGSDRSRRLRRVGAVLAVTLGLVVTWAGVARPAAPGGAAAAPLPLTGTVEALRGRGGEAGGRADAEIAFRFDWAEGRAVLVLDAYAAAGQALAVRVNGRDTGLTVPGGDVWLRAAHLELPRGLLRPGANLLTLRPAAAGPEGPWAVTRVRLDQAPLPAPDLAAARRRFAGAVARWEVREVGLENTWQACAGFAAARDGVEGLIPRPVLHREAAERLAECRAALRVRFESLWFTASRHERFGRQEAARRTHREVLERLPDPADPRHQLARLRLDAL